MGNGGEGEIGGEVGGKEEKWGEIMRKCGGSGGGSGDNNEEKGVKGEIVGKSGGK